MDRKKIKTFSVFTNDNNNAEIIPAERVNFKSKVTSNGWTFEVGMKVKSTKYTWVLTIDKIFEYGDVNYVTFKREGGIRKYYGRNFSDEKVQSSKIDNLFLTPFEI